MVLFTSYLSGICTTTMTSQLGTFRKLNGLSHKLRPDTSVFCSLIGRHAIMKRCVSYKGQFVSDGKDPLRAGSDHYADSIGQAKF